MGPSIPQTIILMARNVCTGLLTTDTSVSPAIDVFTNKIPLIIN